MTIAQCLQDDPTCETSPKLAEAIIKKIVDEATEANRVIVNLKRFDISYLTTEQQHQVMQVLNTENCTCGCGMTITNCLRDDPTCETSPQLARIVVDAVVSGVAGASSANTQQNAPQSDQGNWYNEVVGRQLVYIYVGKGYREKHQIWLCSDGSFQSSGQGGSISSLGSAAFSDGGNYGRWAVNGNVLTLAYANGGTAQLSLSFYDGFLYLNDTKYFRTENDLCN